MQEKPLVRPLTEHELRTIYGGGWFDGIINWFKKHFSISKDFDPGLDATYPDYNGHYRVNGSWRF